MTGAHNLSTLILGFADPLYDNIESANYHKGILWMSLLHRFDCVLKEPMGSSRTPQTAIDTPMPVFGHLRSGTAAGQRAGANGDTSEYLKGSLPTA